MGLGRDMVYGVGAVAASPVWGWSMLRTGKWRTDWAGRFGKVKGLKARGEWSEPGGEGSGPSRRSGLGLGGGQTLLIHGVSVGEVNLIRLLVEELAARSPGLRIVIAATTNTGFAQAEKLYGGRIEVVRFPLDFSFAAKRFLDAVKPDVVASVELEVWPNFVEQCARRGVPFCVINGRLSARSFGRYMKVRPLVRGSFAKVAKAGVQTAAYAERFVALGMAERDVAVLDTMKWDTAKIEDPAQVEGAEQLAAELGIDRGRPLVVAGSTGPGEDAMLVEGLAGLVAGGDGGAGPRGVAARSPGLGGRGSGGGAKGRVQLLIAPRKPEWFEEVMWCAPGAVRRTASRVAAAAAGGDADAEASDGTGASAGASPHTRSEKLPAEGDGADVFLLDTIGELRRAYALADVCVVGRSFTGKLYGSDVMEPVGLGKPTVIGPYHGDFAETVSALREAGGLVVSGDPCGAVVGLLGDIAGASAMARAGQAVIRGRQGATSRHADMLLEVLNESRRRRRG